MSLGAASGMPTPLCTGPSSPALDDEQASLVRHKVTHGATSLHFNLRLLPWGRAPTLSDASETFAFSVSRFGASGGA